MDFNRHYNFITKPDIINKLLIKDPHKIPKITQITCRFETAGQYTPSILATVEMLFELLLQQKVIHSRTYVWRRIKGKRKRCEGQALFGTITRKHKLNRLLTNLNWFFNFNILTLHNVFFKEKKQDLIKINSSKIKELKEIKINKTTAYDFYNFYQKTGIKHTKKDVHKNITLDQQIVNKILRDFSEERQPMLIIPKENNSSQLKLNFYYFNFKPFIKENSLKLTKHFSLNFYFKENIGVSNVEVKLLNNILLLNAIKLNWMGVEKSILKKIKPIKK